VNPLYDRLAKGFAGYFDRWSGLPQIQLPAVELRPGMHGGAVGALRRRLGLKQGDRYDAELARAVRRFEAAHALDADGIADPATIAALNRGYRHYERIIQANLDRARALPASGERFVLVDTAGARLWLFDRGEAVDTMRVIVGKEAMATPEMAALIRFAALNPVWNVPPDLIRTSVARQVLKQGVGYLRRQRLQVLSDWSPGARVLNPAQVDWRAVAAGRRLVQVRQLPGPGNVMGKVKFMFPNKLGIYLHDTPTKTRSRQGSGGSVPGASASRTLIGWAAGSSRVKCRRRAERPSSGPICRSRYPSTSPI
jgi:murein L,D-transpeptidase YcbB/YkuD